MVQPNVGGTVVRSDGTVEDPTTNVDLTTDRGDDSVTDFVALFAALLSPPAPTVALPPVGGDTLTGSVVGDESPLPDAAAEPANTTAVSVEITFSESSPWRAVAPTTAARTAVEGDGGAGQTLRRLFPPKTAPAAQGNSQSLQQPARVVAARAEGPPAADAQVTGADLSLAQSFPREHQSVVGAPGSPIQGLLAEVGIAGTRDAPNGMPNNVVEDLVIEGSVGGPAHGEQQETKQLRHAAPARMTARSHSGEVALHSALTLTAEIGAVTANDTTLDNPIASERNAAVVLASEGLTAPPLPRATTPSGSTSFGEVVAVAAATESRFGGETTQQDGGEQRGGEERYLPAETTDEAGKMSPAQMPEKASGEAAGGQSVLAAPAAPASVRVSSEQLKMARPEAAAQPADAPPRVRTDQTTVVLDRGDGSDRVRVSVRGSVVHATILTESGHQENLLGRVDELRRALGDRGFTDAHVSIRALPTQTKGVTITPTLGGPVTERQVATHRSGDSATSDGTPKRQPEQEDAAEHRGRRAPQEEVPE